MIDPCLMHPAEKPRKRPAPAASGHEEPNEPVTKTRYGVFRKSHPAPCQHLPLTDAGFFGFDKHQNPTAQPHFSLEW
jgi:hypothetical protein